MEKRTGTGKKTLVEILVKAGLTFSQRKLLYRKLIEEGIYMVLKIQIAMALLLFLIISSSCVIFESAEDCFNNGVKLSKQNKNEEAIKYFDKAIELDPDNADAKTYKEKCLKALGK